MASEIYIFQPTDNKSNLFHTFEGSTAFEALVHLKTSLIEKKDSYVNWAEAFQDKGLHYSDYEWSYSNETETAFTRKSSSSATGPQEICFSTAEPLPMTTRHLFGLHAREVSYYRRSLLDSKFISTHKEVDGALTFFTELQLDAFMHMYVNKANHERFTREVMDVFKEGQTFAWVC